MIVLLISIKKKKKLKKQIVRYLVFNRKLKCLDHKNFNNNKANKETNKKFPSLSENS